METQTHDGSMVLLYMVLHGSHQYTPVMLASIYQHPGATVPVVSNPVCFGCFQDDPELPSGNG